MNTIYVGKRIRQLREMKELSQENMAGNLGMSLAGYGKIERDETDVPFSRLRKIAETLGVNVGDLVNPESCLTITFNNSTATNTIGYNQTHVQEVVTLYEARLKEKEAEIARLQSLLEKVLSNQ